MAAHALRAAPAGERKAIDARAALASVVRSWLALRDTALWNFAGGVDPGVKLPLVSAEAVARQIADLNQQREMALTLAAQIAEVDGDLTVQAVLNQEVAALLSAEAPAFSLALAHLPASF